MEKRTRQGVLWVPRRLEAKDFMLDHRVRRPLYACIMPA